MSPWDMRPEFCNPASIIKVKQRQSRIYRGFQFEMLEHIGFRSEDSTASM